MVTAKIGALWFIIAALLSVVGLTAMVVQVLNLYREDMLLKTLRLSEESRLRYPQ